MPDDRAPWESAFTSGRPDPSAEELAELRELLVGPERRRLKELERRLDAVGVSGEELAELLPEAIALRSGRDRQLARALAPTIEGAIGESVRRNPREIASAIFPVLGPAIRKAIAETLSGLVASINSTIEHSLSPHGLRWRLEAWRTGVPYAQIVLKHALIYRVEQVFLIHAETGLLLAHAWAPELKASDPELISGMLTAIRDFVVDSFSRERDAGGLRRFSVGELTVMVEQGPRAVLAAVVRGQAPDSLLERLQDTLETVHLQFAGALADFDGDAAAFEPARPLLEECLTTVVSTDRARQRRGMMAWLPWAIAGLLVVAVLGGLAIRSNRRWARRRQRAGVATRDRAHQGRAGRRPLAVRRPPRPAGSRSHRRPGRCGRGHVERRAALGAVPLAPAGDGAGPGASDPRAARERGVDAGERHRPAARLGGAPVGHHRRAGIAPAWHGGTGPERGDARDPGRPGRAGAPDRGGADPVRRRIRRRWTARREAGSVGWRPRSNGWMPAWRSSAPEPPSS